MACADFSSLPELVQIGLIQKLSLTDRGQLACCSSRLSTLMERASVWKDVTIPLTMDIVTIPKEWGNDVGMLVDRLREKDITMIKKYGQHFERVRVVMSSGHIDKASAEVLTDLLCQSHVTRKCVSLEFDQLLSKAVACRARSPALDRPLLERLPTDMLLSKPLSGRRDRQQVLVVGEFIEQLKPDTDLTIRIPTYVGLNDVAQQCMVRVCNLYTIQDLYCNPRSQKVCSLLKTLVLSKAPQTEEELALWHGLSSPPTAKLIANFPNVQELHVNIINLSDQLLLELADSSGRRSALQSLVIRQVDSGHKPFPELTSGAWGQLAEASPSLSVQCCVASDYVALLLDVIKPETPLVRLEVIFHQGNDINKAKLRELCNKVSGTGDRGTRDRGTGDRGTGDRGTKDSGTGDRGTKDSGTGDSGTGDRGTGDRGTGDRGTRDRGTRDRGTQDSSTGDRGSGDRGTQDSGTGDRGTGDRGTRDRGTKDSGTRDRGTKDRGTRDVLDVCVDSLQDSLEHVVNRCPRLRQLRCSMAGEPIRRTKFAVLNNVMYNDCVRHHIA